MYSSCITCKLPYLWPYDLMMCLTSRVRPEVSPESTVIAAVQPCTPTPSFSDGMVLISLSSNYTATDSNSQTHCFQTLSSYASHTFCSSPSPKLTYSFITQDRPSPLYSYAGDTDRQVHNDRSTPSSTLQHAFKRMVDSPVHCRVTWTLPCHGMPWWSISIPSISLIGYIHCTFKNIVKFLDGKLSKKHSKCNF